MALWTKPTRKEFTLGKTERPDPTIALVEPLEPVEPVAPVEPVGPVEPGRRSQGHLNNNKESIIAAGLTVEGKIDGGGNLRIAGRFEGDLKIRGDLNIESGAHIGGDVHAQTVTIAGEVEGNINASGHVKLLESGQVKGDLKANSLDAAAGSRMHGNVEFGWEGKESKKAEVRKLAEKNTVEQVGTNSIS